MKSNLNLNDIHALLIDMDGVLWRGNTPLPGLTDFFDFLQRRGLPFMLATNNASKTPAQYVQKLANFGVTVDPKHILTSSLATAIYLKQAFKKNRATVYVVGQEGLREAMSEAGFTVLEDSSQPAEAVVAGIDFTLTYEKLKHAVLLIQRGARFIGTNGDLTFPLENGFAPGAGSILAAIQAATGVSPTIIGKPERFMFDLAVQKMGSTPEHTAMLGDRLETDILGGQQAGLKTIMVLTGVDNEDSIAQKGIQPDVIFGGIDELTQHWAGLVA
jgi:4-nitrophenyl phosphatase